MGFLLFLALLVGFICLSVHFLVGVDLQILTCGNIVALDVVPLAQIVDRHAIFRSNLPECLAFLHLVGLLCRFIVAAAR